MGFMEKALTELVGASPIAVALLIAMWLFVQFLKGERETRAQQSKDCHEAHEKLVQRCEVMTNQTNDVMRECAKQHGAVAEALRTFRMHNTTGAMQ